MLNEFVVSVGEYALHLNTESHYVQIYCKDRLVGTAVYSRGILVGKSGECEHYVWLELEKALVEAMYV